MHHHLNPTPRRRRMRAAAVGLALAVLAACGGESNPATDSGGDTPSSDGAPTTDASAPSTATVAFGSQVLSLDPLQAVDTGSVAGVNLIAGTLYELKSDGALAPGLAESGTVSDDGLSWTFVLREGLLFSDGSPLTASDVKATIERSKADAANLYPWMVAPIVSVEAPSPTEVVIELDRQYTSLPNVLAQPAMMIMPAAGLDAGASFFDAPVSAGQYRLDAWGGSASATFVVNEHYFGDAPAIQTLEFVTIEDVNTRLAQVKSGQVDLAIDLPPSLLPQISGDGVVGSVVPLYGFVSVIPNNEQAPFDDPKVRRALSAALDRDKLNEVVWGGNSIPLAGFWPPSFDGHDASISTGRDLDAARAELVGTACESGCSATLMFGASTSWAEPMALVVQDSLKEIGIDITLEKLDSATAVDRLVNGDFSLTVSYLYDYVPVPDGMLAYGLVSDGGLWANFSRYVSPEMDAAAQAAVLADEASRPAALAAIEEQFAADAPYANTSAYGLVIAGGLAADVLTMNSSGFIEVGRVKE